MSFRKELREETLIICFTMYLITGIFQGSFSLGSWA